MISESMDFQGVLMKPVRALLTLFVVACGTSAAEPNTAPNEPSLVPHGRTLSS